jgi:hypothetical protein
VTRIVLSWIGTDLLKQYKLGAYKYGTACRTVELGARTWGMSSMQHELISCITCWRRFPLALTAVWRGREDGPSIAPFLQLGGLRRH